jgi:hypothetical protein
VEANAHVKEAVCIHTEKIFDSCKDKDCLEDLRVYITANSQMAIDNAISVRSRSAELIYVSTDVEPVKFNKGFYTVDMRFFYKIRGEVSTFANAPMPITGLSIFDKRVMLYGSEGNAKIFRSDDRRSGLTPSRLPVAVVETVDPIILDMKMVDACGNPGCDCEILEVPESIATSFDSPLLFDSPQRRLYTTLGQFSIVRLERDSQLLIPAYDYCIPDKECVGDSGDDPCTLFSRIDFPVDEFFPPDSLSMPEGYREVIESLN